MIDMNALKKKIFICNFAKTISSAVLTAVAINIIMENATKYSLIEGLIPFALAIIIVALVDIYQYICEKKDLEKGEYLEKRVQELGRKYGDRVLDLCKWNYSSRH